MTSSEGTNTHRGGAAAVINQAVASWVAPALAAAGVGAGIATWIVATDEATLRQQLTRWQFWVLEFQFVLLVGFGWSTVAAFVRSLQLRRRDLYGPLAAFVLAVTLTAVVAPHTNRIYYDEHIYQGIGQNLSDLRLAQMCNDGTVEYGHLQCWRGEYNKQPYGYPYLLSVAYRLVGVNDRTAHVVNILCCGLLTWVVFLIAIALLGDVTAGQFAALIVALTPEQLLWSHTAAAEPSTTLFSAVAVLAALCFVRLRTTWSLAWLVVSCAFAVQFRPESLLVVVVALLVVVLYARDEFRRARFWWASVLGLALCAIYIGHLYAVRNEGWGTAGPRMALGYFWPNLRVNGGFHLWDARFPVVYTLLAFVSLVQWPTRATSVSITYFALFWGVFLFFHAGSYNYGADVRYSLLSVPAIAIMAGAGASRLTRTLSRLPSVRVPISVVGLALCAQFSFYMPLVRAVGEEAWGARADVAFAREAGAKLPRNSLVLTHNPSVFLLRGINAAQLSLASGDENWIRPTAPTRYAGGIFLHWNFWCNVDDRAQQDFCTSALDRFSSRLFIEERMRTYRFAFYELTVPQVYR